MPKTTQKRSKRVATTQQSGLLSGISRAFNSLTGNRNSSIWNFVSETTRFTRSGVVSVSSFAWYFVTSAMVVVFPIRRAVEIDLMMDEQRQAESQRFNPDSVLPAIPGMYSGGSGLSSVPITPHY